MRISTKGRYALRLMLDLAIYGQGQYVSVRSVSVRQQISEKYLEQIIHQLCKAGFVRSARGANGGYQLSHSPESYTVGMILCLMEGSLAPVPCLDFQTNTCPRAPRCATVELWKKLQDAIDDVVNNVTLADLVARDLVLNPPLEPLAPVPLRPNNEPKKGRRSPR